MRISGMIVRRFGWTIGLAAAFFAAPAMAACGVATPQAGNLGTDSGPALKQAVAPAVSVYSGFNCPTGSVLTLLGANFLKATVPGAAVLQLTGPGGAVATYTLFADAALTKPLTPGTATFYINGTLIDLLGLAGGGAMNVPIYVKPASATVLAAGTYTGSFTVRWDYSFCTGIAVGGLCVGAVDAGTNVVGTVNLTLNVAANPVTMTIGSTTTWDPISTTNNPKSLPGSKRRTTITVTNPDIAVVDLNTLSLVLPTAAKTAVALDGDGTGSAVVQMTQGSTASALTLSYVSAASQTDNVDFSSDGGTSWAYAPTAGDATTQAAVTNVRFRPQGSMAANSSFSVSIPYSVK